jgi:hypothetical protein
VELDAAEQLLGLGGRGAHAQEVPAAVPLVVDHA